jgi:SAM-dependent methyltransferase
MSYTLPNEWRRARERLAGLEHMYDPATIRQLEKVGVGAGWQCLDVGAGGGSISEWLCARVGLEGCVVATDVNTRFLNVLDLPNLIVRTHDVVAEELPAAQFDLVHARAVLCHLPERSLVMDRMVAALKPGAWVLLEEPDYATRVLVTCPDVELASLFERVSAAYYRFVESRGFVRFYGRSLLGELRARGLTNSGSDGYATIAGAGSALTEFTQLGLLQLRDQLVLYGGVTNEQINAFCKLLDDDSLIMMGPMMVQAWGQKPL